jgi:hypothetical protein
MVIGGIVHARPCVDRPIVVPWTKLIDDNLSLVKDCLQKRNGWEGGVNSVAHCDYAILGMSNGTLRGVLPMDAWCHIFDLSLGLCEEALEFTGGFIIEALGRGCFA